jgi:hypothetical protein
MRVVVAGLCAATFGVVPTFPALHWGGIPAWLAVIGFLFWRMFRGGSIAYMTVTIFAAFYGFFLTWAAIADLAHHLAAREAVEAMLASAVAVLLWSRPVAQWVGERRAQSRRAGAAARALTA